MHFKTSRGIRTITTSSNRIFLYEALNSQENIVLRTLFPGQKSYDSRINIRMGMFSLLRWYADRACISDQADPGYKTSHTKNRQLKLKTASKLTYRISSVTDKNWEQRLIVCHGVAPPLCMGFSARSRGHEIAQTERVLESRILRIREKCHPWKSKVVGRSSLGSSLEIETG